jgi:hypothetical protein
MVKFTVTLSTRIANRRNGEKTRGNFSEMHTYFPLRKRTADGRYSPHYCITLACGFFLLFHSNALLFFVFSQPFTGSLVGGPNV